MLFLAFSASMAMNAETYSGTIIVNRLGQTNTSDVTVTVTQSDNGLYTLVLEVPMFGTMVMSDVPASTIDGITVFSADRDVETNMGVMRTIMLTRSVNGMMTADLNLPDQYTTMHFDNVGNHFQLPNSDMEDWNSSYTDEPNRWHGFKSAGGSFAGTSASIASLGSSDDVRPGATGHSAVLTAGTFIGIVANGTMTNGKLMAGSYSATSTDNHAEMDKANGTDDFYMPLYAKPDKFNVWLKYTQGTANANNKANVSVKTFDGTYYQEPVDKVYTNLSGSIMSGSIPAGDWTFYSFPFDYDSYADNNATSEAIFVTFSTNGNPGQGSKNDALYVDDIELVYLAEMTDLRYQGTTIDGWDPTVTEYTMELAGEPDLNDFTADIVGASAILAKSMEQLADGSFRIAISVVSGDLQTAICYIIRVTAPTGKKGDVNGDGNINTGDLSVLISYLLNGSGDINEYNADMNDDTSINIGDLSTLITYLLNN